jgi:hypothetical protein
MGKTDHQYLENLQRMFDEPDFAEMVGRVKLELFDQWQRERKLDNREKIHAKMEAIDHLVGAMRSAADSIAFDKKRSR